MAVPSQTVQITTTGSQLTFQVVSNYNTPGCSSFIFGQTGNLTPATLTVGLSTANLTTGTYNCYLTVSSTTPTVSPITIPVNVNVGGGGTSGSISVSPTSLALSAPNSISVANATLTLTNTANTGNVSFNKGAYTVYVGFFTGSNPNWRNMPVSQGDKDSNNRVKIGKLVLK